MPISAAASVLRLEDFVLDLGIGNVMNFRPANIKGSHLQTAKVGHPQNRRPAVIPSPASGRPGVQAGFASRGAGLQPARCGALLASFVAQVAAASCPAET